MEPCKNDGETMNNRDVAKEDRISELPEALILKILSLLPTEEAIATSVLSKQWQSLWTMLPKLKFDSSYHHKRKRGTFSKNVCKTMLSHKAPVLRSLHLKVFLDRCNAKDISDLIGIALSRNVRKLVLQVDLVKCVRIPESLFNFEKLETLKLKFFIRMDVPSSVCLKSLRTLHLRFIDFKDDESVINLLTGCPNLENLMVHRYPSNSMETFTIAVPSLQRLTIYDYTSEHSGYVINAPSLKYLKIEGLRSLVMENVTMLVEANLIYVSNTIIENLLGYLTSVKRLFLELSSLEIKFPTGNIFYQLVYLELLTYKAEWWNLLTLMLDSSPKLQVLKLNDKWRSENNRLAIRSWNQPKNVPGCLLFHLETFVWEGCKRLGEDEKEVAKYILRNTNSLKKATFSRIIYEENNSQDMIEMVEMVEEFESVVRASTSCQLVFKCNLDSIRM
ncbi:PREDICTED: putative F-box/FBD/LRR-repeat protein At4g13965 [Camelina sativa]|uniref:F-box/FBD/LRR-repeat protein At4g13965 n=1 Tax=Camelina sativa TaxID=90675 RepID=A0ABM1QF70_CAMSA|nr:PREDICTED: putative F-box/FBD/LRR-repeat protein At4g13965 [Camelina sativa]